MKSVCLGRSRRCSSPFTRRWLPVLQGPLWDRGLPRVATCHLRRLEPLNF